MKKFSKLNESIGDIHPIHIPNEVLDSAIFWETDGLFNVNLGNLINSLKKHYGYLADVLERKSTEDQITLERSRVSPNSFYIKC